MIVLGSADITVANDNYTNVLRCGHNSLFMFLILSGHPEVELSQLDDLPVSSYGTSLAVLHDGAKEFHVETEVRRYKEKDIDALPLPAIGQFDVGFRSLTPYHFGVIYKVDTNYMYVIDGTTATKFTIPRSRLFTFWTGIAMVRKQSLGSFATAQWPLLLGLFLTLMDLFAFRFLARGTSWDKTGLIINKIDIAR